MDGHKKELRKMNRTELIEIIYALQQNEKLLRKENEELQQKLNDKILIIDQAGSIAQASISLNHVFDDAQCAAEQYLLSTQYYCEELKRKTEEECRLLKENNEI
ncbi:MAG: hypothetical protein LUG46_01560 [Erysipelotrichaceae bacterium]|nr:hypothetical protein [Erysipelotrichaceae bacterium]